MALPRNNRSKDWNDDTPKAFDNSEDEFFIDETTVDSSRNINTGNNSVFRKDAVDDTNNTPLQENISEVKQNKPVNQKKVKQKAKTNDVVLDKKNNWLYWLIGILVAILVIGGIFLIIGLSNNSNGENIKDYSKGEAITEEVDFQSGDTDSENSLYEDLDEDNFSNKISEEEYIAQSPWNQLSIEEAFVSDKLIQSDNYISLSSSAASLPSEAAGYTSNIDELLLEDGTYNPMFSYLTQENFSRELTIIIESLTNPFFGGWIDAYQTGNADSFTGDHFPFYDSSGGQLPLFIDTSGNAFGMINGGVPVINSISNDFNFGDEITINTVANVTISGFNDDNQKVDKNIILNLNLKANPDGENYPRILLVSGTIEYL